MKQMLSKVSKIVTVCLVAISTVFTSAVPILAHASTKSSLGFDGEAIVKEAEKHIGKGYVWGAEGPNVFDCSGFTMYVFGQVGYSIPRTAEAQREYMMANSQELPKANISQWNKGDLIFYGNNGYAEHVAIYAGDGYVIDCLGSQVSSLPGVTKHKYDGIVDKNGHQYAILGVYAVAEPTGEFQIQKVSEKEGWALEGAVFEITNNSTGKKITRTTNADGKINVTNLEPGTYTVREVKAPNGYFMSSTEKVVTIKGGETIVNNKVVFTNARPTGKIVLTKYNFDKSEVIPNTEYDVRYPDGTVKHVITDKNGKIVLDKLTQFGTYIFKETKAAPGYIIDTYPIYVELSADGATTSVILKEVEHINYEPTGILNITKNDSSSGQTAQGDATLAGAEYVVVASEDIWNTSHTKVMYKKGQTVATRTTKDDGTMEPVRGLYMGSYEVYETKAPVGYELNPTRYKVTFTKEDETKEIIKYLDVEDDVISGSIAINKVTDSAEDGSTIPLEYIPFTLTNKHGLSWNGLTDENGYLEFNDLPYGTYILNEEACENNEGLSLLKDKEIIIDGTKDIYEYTIVNHASSMEFHKIDAETKKPLKGATLAVMEQDTGFIVDQWISNGNAHKIKGLINGKQYTLQEIKAPEGYELASPVNFIAKDGGSIILENARIVEKVNIQFSKKDITSKDELPGAHLMIKEYETNKIVKEWVSTNTPTIVELEKGKKYIFEETLAPDGYVQSEMIIFTAGDEKVITMFDDYTKVSIQKVDEKNNPVVGAKLQLSKEDGTIVKTWTSTDTPLLLTKLARGKYVLTELEAPEGYEISNPVTFEVINDAKLIEVKMVDKLKPIIPPEKPNKVEMWMSKQDITEKTEIPGAKMELIDKETGKIIDSWISGTTPHKVTVMKDKEYILSEITAPDGYLKAENITFTAGEGKTITMYDDYTKVLISKQDFASKKELPGATLILKDSDGNIVDKWTSTNEAHMIHKLKPGKYTLIEESAPKGYEIAEDITFEVKETGEIQNVTMYDKAKKTSTSANTSDNTSVAGLAFTSAISLAGLALIKSKKKNV